jgi:hypothetical protein
MHEQTLLDNYLCEGLALHYPHLLKLPYLQTPVVRARNSKVITFFCQHEETAVMDILRATLGRARQNCSRQYSRCHFGQAASSVVYKARDWVLAAATDCVRIGGWDQSSYGAALPV